MAADWTSRWAYLIGPVADGTIAVGIAYVLHSRGDGRSGVAAVSAAMTGDLREAIDPVGGCGRWGAEGQEEGWPACARLDRRAVGGPL
jgi:hypothetical protein